MARIFRSAYFDLAERMLDEINGRLNDENMEPGGLDYSKSLSTTGIDNIFPWHINLPVLHPATMVGGWGPVYVLGTHNAVEPVEMTSSGAQNDEITFKVNLAPGTWEIAMYHSKDGNRGIYSFYIDDVLITTVDGYAAALSGMVRNSTSFSDLSRTWPSVKELKIKMASKNAASAGYYACIQTVTMLRQS